jgi:hypothetical protein
LGGLIVLARSRWQHFSDAQLSDDATWITVARPYPAFEAEFAPYIPAAAEVWNSRGRHRRVAAQDPSGSALTDLAFDLYSARA